MTVTTDAPAFSLHTDTDPSATPSWLDTTSLGGIESNITTGGSCSGRWVNPNHLLFQLAHAAMLMAFLAPSTTHGVVMLHATLVIGFLMMSGWAWAVICAPDIFSWNFSFMVINSVQMLFILYRVRPIKFTPELEDVYNSMFKPLKVSRKMFKKLVAPDMCAVLSLQRGEPYAKQEATRTDRLGLLVSGSARVLNQGQLLHLVKPKQFFDSPEFESTAHYDDKFHVTIMAETSCRYIYWQRHSLEYLFAKEAYLATVMGSIIGRDITNKLYSLNETVRQARSRRVDIRLTTVSSALLAAGRNGNSGDHHLASRGGKKRESDVSNLVAGDSAFDLGVEDGEEGAYCSLLQHDMSRHHHYDISSYHYDNGTDEQQMVMCNLL